jgi:hypothetical protein
MGEKGGMREIHGMPRFARRSLTRCITTATLTAAKDAGLPEWFRASLKVGFAESTNLKDPVCGYKIRNGTCGHSKQGLSLGLPSVKLNAIMPAMVALIPSATNWAASAIDITRRNVSRWEAPLLAF